MIVRLKAIKFKDNIFCYLFFYLHRSIIWHLFILTSIVLSDCWAEAKNSSCIKNVWLYQDRRFISLRHQIVCKLLSCCREVLRIVVILFLLLCPYLNAVYQCLYPIVIVFVIIIWFENCSNDRFYYTIWLTLQKSERPKT